MMPAPQTLEKSPATHVAAQPRKRNWGWLVAPLMGMSFVLHIGLLFLPLPAQETVEEEALEEEAPAEEPEILSLSAVDLPPEPVETPPQPEQSAAPPPAGDAAPRVPDDIPANLADTSFEDNDGFEDEPVPVEPEGPGAFDPERQRALLGAARQYLDQSEFGGINSNPGLVGASIAAGWPNSVDSGCFFERFEPEPQPARGASDAMFFTRNLGLVRANELPSLVQGELFQQGNYCNAEFYEVLQNGVSVLFLSLIGIGDGNPPGSAVAVFWASDPRP
ncbi:MAG: hypothetical protein HC812_11215 [Leptolyngbya sp. RL_3_1]|nr:hypothetical protein [Leptolyngbya sp. RL_3_1]